jgi:hypothetical protein
MQVKSFKHSKISQEIIFLSNLRRPKILLKNSDNKDEDDDDEVSQIIRINKFVKLRKFTSTICVSK